MEFGIIKTKIEDVLLESYKNNTFNKEIKTFKTLVLEDKKINKLFYIYDELTTNKGLSSEITNDYINEMVSQYNQLKITSKDLKKVNEWVKNSKTTDNNYSVVDNILSNDILTLESKILSKKIITETLTKQPISEKEVVSVPLTTMVNLANKTISNYIDGLNESEKKELNQMLSVDDSELEPKYTEIKENVIEKLQTLYNQNHDYGTRKSITETIEKISTEKYDKLNYYKLKNLSESI